MKALVQIYSFILSYLVYSIFFFLFSLSLSGQVYFQRTIGTSLTENAYSFLQIENGYIIVGTTNSSGAGNDDILILKTDLNFNTVWSKTIGGNQNDFPRSIIACSDGGYAILGSTFSFGVGDEEIILIKLSQDLELQWVKTYGRSNAERGFCIIEDSDGYIIGGTTTSGKGALVIKTDLSGSVIWSRTYGFNASSARCFNVLKTEDGNYLFDGPFKRSSQDFAYMLIEVNPSGNLIMAKSYNGNGNDHTRDILKVDGDGYYVFGHSTSFGNGSWDFLLLKVDLYGNFQWARNYGNIEDLWSSEILLTSDNNLLLTGHNGVFGDTDNDIVILKCDMTGNLLWSKSYGGSGVENQKFGNHETVCEIDNSFFLAIGQTSSFGVGSEDIYMIAFDDQGFSACNVFNYHLTINNPTLVGENIALPVNNFDVLVNEPSLTLENIDLIDSLLCPVLLTPIAGFQANNTIICSGNCIDFTDLSLNQPSMWNWYFEGAQPDTSSLQFPLNICYSDTGCFDVQLIVSNISGSDTLTLNDYICVKPIPEISLGNDTVLCLSDTFTLQGPPGNNIYLWSNGSTASQLSINSSGNYWLRVENEYGCVANDTIRVYFGYAKYANLGNDSTICQGEMIILDPGAGYSSYVWQDGSTQQEFNVFTSGVYWVEVTDSLGCVKYDTVVIDMIEVPDLFIGNDTNICDNSILLDAGHGFDNYVWQDGFLGQQYTVTFPGVYWVTADVQGCVNSDTILIVLDCPSNLWFPNCFTPNADGVNDKFKPEYENIFQYQLYVFNRWGQLIYDSNNIDEGWDGTIKGRKCPFGVYFFIAEYREGKNGINRSVSGSITLLR